MKYHQEGSRMLRFIHAADLHLGNTGPSTLGLSPKWVERIKNASYKAFNNLIDKALELKVDFILLSGDLLDTSTPTLRSQLELYKGLNRLSEANIKVFMVGGNHDPLNLKKAQSEMPNGVHLFGDKPETVSFKKGDLILAEISGISYPTAKVTEDLSLLLKPGSEGFQIALLHTNVAGYGNKDNYSPSELDSLVRTGFDYWALGHVHTKAVLNENPYVVYPGTTQGQHINETGPKGFYLVEVDQKVKIEFINSAVYFWENLEFEAFGTLDKLDLAFEELIAKAFEIPRVYRIKIKGRTPLYNELLSEKEELETRFKEASNYALESLVLEILPDLDYTKIKTEESLPGEFLRVAEKLREDGFNEEIKEVLAPLYDKLGDILDPLEANDLETILNGSIALGLDLFWRGEKS